MLNFLVETKNEYTSHLINILTPLVFEGLLSIYKEAQQVSDPNNTLKVFQSFLKRIPKWNQSMIQKETDRIINSTHSYGWLNDLIKATLKSNLVILMYNPTVKTQTKVNPSFYQDIKTEDFIHRVYIECARELWNNPYLMYHNYPPIEIKRNQRDCMNIIKECIKESLRKLLPVKHLLQIYLGEDMEINNIDNDEFDKIISEVEERNLTKMIKKDLSNNQLEFNPTTEMSHSDKDKLLSQKVNNFNEEQKGGDKKSEDIGDKILNIINKENIENGILTSINSDSSSLTINNSVTSSINNNSLSNTIENSVNSYKKSLNPNSEFDEKIKNILKKDLASDSDIETSLNYSQEENESKYQEIFSNNGNKTQQIKKDKTKFFKEYLAL